MERSLLLTPTQSLVYQELPPVRVHTRIQSLLSVARPWVSLSTSGERFGSSALIVHTHAPSELKVQRAAMAKEVTVSFLEQGIAVVRMQKGENRINLEFIKAFNDCLDKIESTDSCKGVVTTGEGKFYSNGLDLDWMQKQNTEKLVSFQKGFQELLVRILTFPVVTVAAINGHAYAAGMLLALAHDQRVMNSQRGWICMNEIHTGLRFSPFLISFLKTKINPGNVLHRTLVLGKRYTAEEAESAQLIDKAIPATMVEQESRRLLQAWLGKNGYSRESMLNMKMDVYADLVKELNASKL